MKTIPFPLSGLKIVRSLYKSLMVSKFFLPLNCACYPRFFGHEIMISSHILTVNNVSVHVCTDEDFNIKLKILYCLE